MNEEVYTQVINETLGGILRCRLWMQTNALSRQVALLAEPRSRACSTMSTSSGFFVHTMEALLCDCTIHY